MARPDPFPPPPAGWRCPMGDLPTDGERVRILTGWGKVVGGLVYRHPLWWCVPPLMGDVGVPAAGWQPDSKSPAEG